MSRVLLPGDWKLTGEGLKEINKNDFEGRLYNSNKVEPSGVPSLFAHAFVFSKKLKEVDDPKDKWSAFKKFATLIKGIFLGVIVPKVININSLGVLGKVSREFLPELNSFVILEWEKDPNNSISIGGIYPESLVFPGARMDNNKWEKMRNEIGNMEDRFGKDIVKSHFIQWVIQETGKLPDGGNSPLWADKLFEMINNNDIWNATNINKDNYDNNRSLKDNSLKLTDVKVKDGTITLYRYMEHLIVCGNRTDRMPKNLSNEDKTLLLGGNKHIICQDLESEKDPVCNNCSANLRGKTIDETGFFESKHGNYVIWKDFDNKISLPKGCTDVKYNGDHAILYFGRLRVKIKGEVVDKEKLFCNNVVSFNVDEMHPPKMPDLPIKSEYLDYLEMDNNMQSETPSDITYNIKIKGIVNPVSYNPEIINGGRAGILLFPSFKTKDWKINYIFFYVTTEGEKNGETIKRNEDYALSLFNFDNGTKKSLSNNRTERIRHSGGVKTDLPITHIEVLIKGEQMGIFFDKRNIKVGGGTTKLSFDFGTSNTRFATIGIDDNNNHVHIPLEIKDKTSDILGDKDNNLDKAVIRNNTWWLPSFSPGAPLTLIPSEIIFMDTQSKNPTNLDKPMSKYSIPHPLYERNEAHKLVISNFKWIASKPFESLTNSIKLRKSYIKILMHMALAVLRDEGYNNINFTATYPLAFGSEKYDEYKTLLLGNSNNNGIIEELHEETGMTITNLININNERELISESHAGKAQYSPKGYYIVVDIGGGTTDIALGMTGKEPIAYDSIKYGGNNYVNFLADFLPDDLIIDNPKDNLDIKEEVKIRQKAIILNRKLRNNKFTEEIYGNLNDQQQRKIIRNKLKLFYKVIFVYINNILDGYDINENITFYPVGNAWKFVNAILAGKDLDNFICKYFEKRGDGFKVNHNVGKDAVATGALNIQNYRHPRLGESPVITVVGCNHITIGTKNFLEKDRIPCPVDLKNQDPNSMPSVSTEKFIREFELDLIDDKDKIGIWEKFNDKATSILYFDTDNRKWNLIKSPFSIFLQEIFPKHYLKK